jgi:hypothetical protein
MCRFLTPSQIEDLEEGYSSVVTLDLGDLDTLHAHLTLDWCDESGRRLWDAIQKQIAAARFLNTVSRELS